MSLLRDILQTCRTIAVVGLSSDPFRPSYDVAEYMQRQGYQIIPVNPNETRVLGEICYPRLEDIPEQVDLVNVFRRPEFVPQIVESAIHVRAAAVWLQLGITHEAAAERARAAGMRFVQNRCLLIEHRRFGTSTPL